MCFFKKNKKEDLNKSNYLKREEFVGLVDSDKIWSKELSIDEIKEVLNILSESFNEYSFEIDNNYILNPRRKFLKSAVKEFTDNESQNDLKIIRDALFNFWEFVGDEYFGNFITAHQELGISIEELTKMDDEYRNKGIISLQEKEDIQYMIEVILKYLN